MQASLKPILLARFPRQTIWWHEIYRHFHRLVDGWEEPFPRLGLRCRSWCFRPSWRCRSDSSSHQAQVCPLIINDSKIHDINYPFLDGLVTCLCCLGVDEQLSIAYKREAVPSL